MRRAELALLLGAMLAAGSTALAHPVPIGRYGAVPYGISDAHPYPAARGGERRTGRLRGTIPASAPQLAWTVALPHPRPRGPVVSEDGTLYFGTRGGFHAVTSDGLLRWSVNIGPAAGAPALAPSGLIAVTATGRVVHLSHDGVVLRSTRLMTVIEFSPLVLADGSVLIAAHDGRVIHLDADLRVLRELAVPGSPTHALARTTEGHLAVGADRQLVLTTLRGDAVRTVGIGNLLAGPVVVGDDGTLWGVSVDGTAFAFDASGRARLRTSLGATVYRGAGSALGADGALRVSTARGLVCLGPGGTERWRAIDAPVEGAPSVDEGGATMVVVGNELVAIEADGSERWRAGLSSRAQEAPVLTGDDTIVLAQVRGTVVGLR